MRSISSQHITGKFIRINIITARRGKNILRINIQEIVSIFNQIRNIKSIGKKLISFPTKSPTPDHVGDVVNSHQRD